LFVLNAAFALAPPVARKAGLMYGSLFVTPLPPSSPAPPLPLPRRTSNLTPEDLENITETFAYNIPEVALHFSYMAPSNCTFAELPLGMAAVFAFADTPCVRLLEQSRRATDPPLLWQSNRALDVAWWRVDSSPRYLYAVDVPILQRQTMLRQLINALALEQVLLVTDDPTSCNETWTEGLKVCTSQNLGLQDLLGAKRARTPVLALDL
jgi:hypothetical protein